VLGSNTTIVDHGTTIAISLLGGIYGVIALSAFIVIGLPKLMAGAGTAAAGFAGAPAAGARPGMFPFRPVRPRPPGVRWTPAYRGDVVRPRPDAFLRRQAVQQQRVRRVYAAPNRKFPPLNQVLLQYTALHCMHFGEHLRKMFKDVIFRTITVPTMVFKILFDTALPQVPRFCCSVLAHNCLVMQ